MNSSCIDIEELRRVPSGEPFVFLYSGGKDSALALALACQHSKPYALIHSADVANISYNHNCNADEIQAQATAMGIPLVIINQNPKSNEFLHKLIVLLKEYARKGVKSMVTGTLYDLPSYEFISKVAKIAGVKLCCPLWALSNDEVLDGIESFGIESIICAIESDKIPNEWLGRLYNRETYNEFVKIGIEPFGENGEFHTTLVRSNMYILGDCETHQKK